ncbi:MAG: ATPase, T2SS/T4P/T4SS family, partial [Endomicrobia bacterium]|nr:ATPase, T2SS/T4P/T4SS family [Endomicrobiia bacterium]
MQKCVLIIDDASEILVVFKKYLESAGFFVVTAENGEVGIKKVKETKPDVILLDVMMPGMDGYTVCSKLQEQEELSNIPVVFVTALGEEQNKAKAFACGAVDYLMKPPTKEQLIDMVKKHLKMTVSPTPEIDIKQRKKIDEIKGLASLEKFNQFKKFIRDRLNLPEDKFNEISQIPPIQIYSLSKILNIPNSYLAQFVAEFLKWTYIPYIDIETVELGVLPTSFCKRQDIIPLIKDNKKFFVVSNPFSFELIESLSVLHIEDREILLTEPENITMLFQTESKSDTSFIETISKQDAEVIEKESEKSPVTNLLRQIIHKAVSQRVSDIHIEPKEDETIIRFRIDGDLYPVSSLSEKTAVRLIARIKILAGLDIAEKRRPQDGGFRTVIGERTFNCRVATAPTSYGENVVMRLLEPNIKPKSLEELGMTVEQTEIMKELTNRIGGLVLVVGTTGSGKTTTIYSLINKIDLKKRSLLTIEDPVEYTIPEANQQQVNEKIGVTFESLLRSAMRQDPNVLFIGEIRDNYSATVAIEMATTGHLTFTTLHSSNTTAAIFRFETLGISRSKIADAVIAIIAQKLLKVLCPNCKKISSISEKEKEMLLPYTKDIPITVANKVGCSKCNYTGFYGRKGVYEILRFDTEITKMVRSGKSIIEIRNYIRNRGDYLIADHAIQEVKNLNFSIEQIYRNILV